MTAETPRSEMEVAIDRRRALGRNVNRLMEARRMSFRDTSKATGLSTTGLYKIVDGTSDPSLSSLWKIADFFGVTIQSLVSERSPRKEKSHV